MTGRVLIAVALIAAALPAPSSAASNAPAVARETLANGLQVVAVRDSLAHVVTTVVTYKVGAEEDPPKMPGMAHAQEHMMFRGSPGLSAAQFGEISAAMGGDSNAFTESADTQFYSTVPAEDLDAALHIEAARMRDVLDDDANWSQEREAIEQEVARDRSDPEYVVTAAARSAMFSGTPFADDGLGTQASFNAMTAADLKRFYNTWYGPNNAVLVIAGDIDTKRVIAGVERLFEPIPRRRHPAVALASPAPGSGTEITVHGDQTYPSVFIAYPMPGYRSPDYAAGSVLSDVLSDRRSDLHWFPSNWANGVGFWTEVFPSGGIAYAVADIPAGEDSARMIKVLKNNIDDYITDGFPERAVEAAKRRALVRLEAERGSVRGLALAWATAIAVEGRSSPDDDVAAIEKVNVDDINRVAATYLKSDDAVVGTVLPAAPGTAVVRPSSAGSNESAAPPIGIRAPSLPVWASAATHIALPRSSIAPTDETLPNGLRLIIQPEAASGTIVVRGAVTGNPILETPAGQEGIDVLLDQIFYEGPADVVDEDWGRELDDTGADLSAGRRFSILALSSDFDRAVQLLADNELHPNVVPAFFGRRRSEVASAVADDLAGPDGRAQAALASALYPSGDPALRVATKESIGGLSFENVDDYYRLAFQPELTTIVVVGDVSVDRARNVVEKYFGAWTADGPRQVAALPRVPLNAPASTVVPAEGHVQDDVSLQEIVAVDRTSADYYALQIANHVLDGGDAATWLYRDVRQDAGLVYSIDSILSAADAGRSTFAIDYGCDPANVSKTKGIVLRDLRLLQTRQLGSDDLRRAKLLLLRRIPLGEQSVDLIADGLLDRAQAGLALDQPVRDAARYMRITPQQVRAAFSKWIRPDGFVQVVEGPPPQ